jgi:hypothetical protein
MEDHKFKVGDKVILTGNTSLSSNKVGDVGWIMDFSVNGKRCKVSQNNNKYESSNWSLVSELELVEEEYFTIAELNLNLGDVIAHRNGCLYTKDEKGFLAENSYVYLSKGYSHVDGMYYNTPCFKIISRSETEAETETTVENKEEKTMTTTSKFVETTTKTVIKESIDALLPNHALISIKPNGESMGSIQVVIGANYSNKRACYFNKVAVGKLIGELTAIHAVMN